MRQYREITFTKRLESGEDPFESDSILTIEADGGAYRRIRSRVTDDHIDVPVTGGALDYERQVLEAKMQMAEMDDLSRQTAKSL